jgi:hypothetical protein
MITNNNSVIYFEDLFLVDLDVDSIFMSDFVLYRLSGILTPTLAIAKDFSSKDLLDEAGLYDFVKLKRDLEKKSFDKFYTTEISLIKTIL